MPWTPIPSTKGCASASHAPCQAPQCLCNAVGMAKLPFSPFTFPAAPVMALSKATTPRVSLNLRLPNAFLDKKRECRCAEVGWIFLKQLAASTEQLCSRFPNRPELGHWLKTLRGPFVRGWEASQATLNVGIRSLSKARRAHMKGNGSQMLHKAHLWGEKEISDLILGTPGISFPSSHPPY